MRKHVLTIFIVALTLFSLCFSAVAFDIYSKGGAVFIRDEITMTLWVNGKKHALFNEGSCGTGVQARCFTNDADRNEVYGVTFMQDGFLLDDGKQKYFWKLVCEGEGCEGE